MNFNPYTIPPILCLLLAVICGVFVIGQNPKAKLNQIFLFICLTFIGWFSFYIPFNFPYSEHQILIWTKISFCFISFIPITTFTFISTYLQIPKNEFWFRINSLIGLVFSILSLSTDWIIKGVLHLPWHPYPEAGILHPLLILHCLSLAYWGIKLTLITLKDKSLSDKRRNHIKYMFIAMIALTPGAIDFLGNYNIQVYQIGYIPVSAYLLITTIAIIKYQLMDIQIILKKSLLYTILIAVIALFYFLSIYVAEHALQNIFKYQSIFISLFFATIIAIVFIPIKNFLEKHLFNKSLGMIAEENDLLRVEVAQTEKFKMVANLASSIAHEIKNPLTALQTFNEYLPQKKNDPEFFDKYQTIVSQELNRINGLAQELLAFAKPCPPQIQQVNPNEIITQIIQLVHQKCSANKINIETKLEAHNLISADPNQLKQALLNIILNAIDAMPDGGILTISTSVIASEAKQSFTISISDTGSGIFPKDLPHIFEPFYTGKEKGTGLGLAITQGIVEKHGGKIFVESKINQGTTFTIKL